MNLGRNIIKSLFFVLIVLIVVYTIWFVYMQFVELPAGYYQHHYGKGAGVCRSGWFCMLAFWGVKCCDALTVIFEYFNIGYVAFFYIYKNFLIPFISLTFISSFTYFLINHEKSISF